MSYDQLAQHAEQIQRLAVQEALKQRGWTDLGHGELRAPDALGEQAAKDLMARTQGQFGGMTQMFAPFLTTPEPTRFDPMIDDLARAMNALATTPDRADPTHGIGYTANPALAGMDVVAKSVQDWRGPAALGFERNFVRPFPAYTANQFGVAAVLKCAVDAERELWTQCRANVDDIAHKAIEALEVMDECDPDEQVCVLTVASSVFAAAATFASGGAAIALNVAGAAAQAWSGVPREEPPRVRFDGQTPQAILTQVRDALNTLAGLVEEKERAIAGALHRSAGVVTGHKDRFLAPRPALADMDAATVTGPAGLGEAI